MALCPNCNTKLTDGTLVCHCGHHVAPQTTGDPSPPAVSPASSTDPTVPPAPRRITWPPPAQPTTAQTPPPPVVALPTAGLATPPTPVAPAPTGFDTAQTPAAPAPDYPNQAAPPPSHANPYDIAEQMMPPPAAIPPASQPEPTKPAKKLGGAGLVVALVAAGVLIVSGLGVGIWWFAQRDAVPPVNVAVTPTNTAGGQGTKGHTQPNTTNPPQTPDNAPITKCANPPKVKLDSLYPTVDRPSFEFTIEPSCPDGDILDYQSFFFEVSDADGPAVLGTVDVGNEPWVIAPDGMQMEVLFPVLYSPDGDFGYLEVTFTPVGNPTGVDSVPADAATGWQLWIADDAAVTVADLSRAGTAALNRQVTADRRTVVNEMTGYWSPQISSKYVGLDAEGVIWGPLEIWREFLALKDQYPYAVLIDSTDWSCYRSDYQYWVTAVANAYTTAEGALDWCNANNRDRDHCYAKLIGNMGPDGTTVYND